MWSARSRSCRCTTSSSTARRPDAGAVERAGYHVFDILWLDGRDVTSLPLEERRALLERAAAAAAARTASPRSTMPKPWERACARRLGRRDREAPRLDLRASPLAALAEDEVRGDAGARRRRLHRSARRARRPRRAARRLLRRRRLRLRRQGRHRLRHEAAARAARAARRARDSESRRSPKPSGCRACAPTGCGPRSSCRSASSNGPATASCATRGCSASASTSRRARSSERRSRLHRHCLIDLNQVAAGIVEHAPA